MDNVDLFGYKVDLDLKMVFPHRNTKRNISSEELRQTESLLLVSFPFIEEFLVQIFFPFLQKIGNDSKPKVECYWHHSLGVFLFNTIEQLSLRNNTRAYKKNQPVKTPLLTENGDQLRVEGVGLGKSGIVNFTPCLNWPEWVESNLSI